MKKLAVVILMLASPVMAQIYEHQVMPPTTGPTSFCADLNGEIWIETGPTCHTDKRQRDFIILFLKGALLTVYPAEVGSRTLDGGGAGQTSK